MSFHKKNNVHLKNSMYFKSFAKAVTLFAVIILSHEGYTQSKNAKANNVSEEELLNQYVQSKGAGIITFDASNIKQFWIDNSVISKDNNINIYLDPQISSIPLRIQLANVGIVQDCKVEAITSDKNVSFSVLNDKSAVLASSEMEQDFIQYQIISSSFHLTDTSNYTFYLRFASKGKELLSIKKIILSFSANKDFLASPGVLKITNDNLSRNVTTAKKNSDTSFSIKGKRFTLAPQSSIFVSDNTLSNTVTIKNIGDKPTTVYFGYAPYTTSGQQIGASNNAYKGINKILKVVYSEANSNKLIVDSYPEWAKGCYVAMNAKEDFSDYPNFSFIEGKIAEVNRLDNDQAEIVFDKPIKNSIEKGTNVRVQASDGASYIYMNSKQIQPGEEVTFTSTIKKDDSFFSYSSKAFSHGTFYVKPLILSLSGNDESEILITDWTITY